MMLGRKFIFLCFVLFLPFFAFADELPAITITENTNPKIAELYQQLQDSQQKIEQIQAERMDKLSDNYKAVKENEQSLANRTLTAATTAATGIGGMELAMGLAEQNADKKADADMAAYIETFRCTYGDGQSVKGGPDSIELPGGNDATMMSLQNEYKTLAASLKERKESLGLKPGIESEVILDKAEMGLYDQENVGITGGAYSSLYRATALNSEADQSKINADKEASANRVKYGGIAAGAGVVGGIAGNAIINKDAPKNESDKINAEYDKQVAEATKEQQDLTNQLNQAIADNKNQVKEYNQKLQQHKDHIKTINGSPKGCQELFSGYISEISALQPVENETDSVPETEWPDISAQQTLLAQCIQCDKKGGMFEPETLACPCPIEKPVDKGDVCAEREPEIKEVPPAEIVTDPDDKSVVEEEKVEEEKKEEEPPADDPAICAVGLKHTAGFGIEAGVTRVGDICTSKMVLHGEVFKRKDGTCGCSAKICEPKNGRVAKKGACVCNEELGWKTDEKTKKCVCDGTNVEGRCSLANDKSAVTDKREYKFYNCCGSKNQIPDGIVCTCIEQFDGYKVTPMEAYGLITEFLLHKKKTAQKNLAKMYDSEVKCDDRPHNGGDRFMQCASTKNDKLYYDFKFKSLDEGNSGFFGAICSIYGLKSGKNSCKDATQELCDEISTAVERTFYPPDGSASLEGSKCAIKEHKFARSSGSVMLNNSVTLDELSNIEGIDSKHFYDKKLQVSASSDIYLSIQNYVFNELHMPIDTFDCGAGFTKNVPVINMTAAQYKEVQDKTNECINSQVNNYTDRSTMVMITNQCKQRYPTETITGDILKCSYAGKPVDFLFKNLNVRWDRKSMGGYQGLKCLDAGGTFAGKTCALADKNQCLKFKETFEKQYPDSKGIEWDDDIGCVLKDAKIVGRVQKVAETTGMVALTLATAVGGGPIMWVFTVVEATALITEAVTENALSNWSNEFLSAAAQCKTSNCANTVLKRHIARIMDGSKYFDETQNKAIAKQTERLCGMLDEHTLDAIVEKGVSAGHIGENRDPDLEKAIREYYGTQLTSDERALLTTKKVATVATFATLIAGGVVAGMRQAFKHNLIHVSEARQIKWIDLKILRKGDVSASVYAQTKTAAREAQKAAKTTKTVTTAAPKTTGSGVAKTWEEELAEIGVREEKTASGAVRYKDTKTGKYISKDEVLKRIDNIPTKQVLTWEEGLAEIGVKEEKTASGAVRYKDTKTGKYISQDEVLRRIDNMPNKSVVKPEGGAVPGGTKPTEPKPETKPTTEPKPETKPTEPESPKGSPVGNPVKSKSQKIAEARKRGDLGYHGTDADIAMDDMIRSSANSSDGLGSVGYGIAKDYDAAEKYAVKRLVERQNLGKNIDFYREGDVLVIESSETLNLSNKTGYVYTTAKESSVEWHTLKNGYVGAFDAAQMPHSVEILDKKAFNLDDLVRQGKVKIIEPNVPKKAPKVTPTPAPKTAPKTTPTPSGGTKPKTTPTPVTPKRTPAQEEAEWRALYEKYAPENQTFDKFKESFGNNLDEVKEYSRAWEEKAIIDKGADERYQKQLADFRKKYGSDDAYYAYVRARYEAEEEAERLGKVYKMPDENTPILKSYTKEQIEDAKNIYQDARTDAVSASAGTPDDYYSTWDPSISKLKREAHQNMAVYSELNNHLNSKNLLTQAEYDNLLNYVEHRTYDEQMLISTFKKDPDLNGISARLYDNFLTAKSKNVRKIDDVAGLHAGSQSDFIATKGRNAIAKNEFVQNFVSKRVSMYEDIITKNPSIYNRAKKWNQLSIEEREKLCKEIFEIADDKLGVEHTGFAVRDLVADFGKSDATQGLQSAGYVYISNRHFPNMSFEDVMDVIAHEQAHKVDHLNPNKGILGSQLSDLGSTEGYIQGYKGHDYADYRLELTEQSSWLIGEEMKKAISRLGL